MAETSAYEHMRDPDLIAIWDQWMNLYEDWGVAAALAPKAYHRELKTRGYVLGKCSGCEKDRVRPLSDFLCTHCRKEQDGTGL